MRAVQLGHAGADLFAEHGRERLGRGLDQRHLEPARDGRGGHFAPDEATADDGQPRDLRELRMERLEIGGLAQQQDPGAGERRGQHGPPAAADDELVVLELRAVGEGDTLGVDVQPAGDHAEHQVDAAIGVRLCRLQGPAGLAGRTAQHVLGQQRAVVRRLLLRADHRQLALEPPLAQGERAPLRGDAAAHDHDVRVVHARPRPPRGPSGWSRGRG